MNLMSNDCDRLFDGCRILMHPFWGMFHVILLSLLLIWQLGALAMVGVLGIAVMPICSELVKKMVVKYKRKVLKWTDQRVKLTTEILQGILLVKMYAWETPFVKRLEKLRRKELSNLKNVLIYKMFAVNLPIQWPWVCIYVTVVCYLKVHEEGIDLATIFVSISIINYLRSPFMFVSKGLYSIGELNVALKRLDTFFNQPETPNLRALDMYEYSSPIHQKGTVQVQGNFYRQSDNSTDCLTNINIVVQPGELIAVVGQVGSGKSTMFHAILGELYPRRKSFVRIGGQIGYIGQSAWIQNATVRDNIIMNQTYEQKKYRRTIRLCALEPDLKNFPDHDLTEVGERGITISGGQKARICLARLLYHSDLTNILLLDEPLAAVDVDVSSILWHTIKEEFKHKTRLVILNSHFDLLPSFDRIVVLEAANQKGKLLTSVIRAVGTFDELKHLGDQLGWFEKMQARDEENKNLHKSCVNDPPASPANSVSQTQKLPDMTKIKKDEGILSQLKRRTTGLMQIEDQETGKVSWTVWKCYFECAAIGSGWGVMLVTAIAYIAGCIFPLLMQIVLTEWMNDEQSRIDQEETQHSTNWWILNLLMWLLLAVAAVGLKSYAVAVLNMWASAGLHEKTLTRVMRAPVVGFFQVTPVGRIINRLAGDLDHVDNLLPEMMQQSITVFLIILSTLILIAYNSPWFLLMVIPLFGAYLMIFNYFRQCSRQIKRLEMTTRSPIFSKFEETLNGLVTVRSLGIQDHFVELMQDMLDQHGKIKYLHEINSRWLTLRVEFLASVVTALSVAIGVFFVEHINPALMSLAIVLAINIGGIGQWGLRCWIDTETHMCGVERLLHYTKNIPVESDEGEKLKRGWMNRGELKFDNLQLRYRPNLPLVLKGLSCEIPSTSKVGIIGRTGAGKSTIMLALFRVVDPCGGKLLIDGYDCSTIHLESLRREISIIPQEPVMFSGTLRWNLDPFDEHKDEEIWRVLRDVQMEDYIRAIGNLNVPVSERGQNFSCGQRQLICIGRALLRKSGLILLDEATASVDTATDRIVQKVMDRLFKDRTMLVIAHRLDTVANSDLILALENGVAKEFASPRELLANSDSIFAQLIGKEKN